MAWRITWRWSRVLALLAGVFPLCAQNPSYAKYTVLFDFNQKAGTTPSGNLVEGLDGNLYGTADYGGTGDGGTAFQATTAGVVTTIHNFCPRYPNCPNGIDPQQYGALAMDGDGNFYGTTTAVTDFPATVFKLTPRGAFTTLYNACFSPDCFLGGGVVMGSDGSFYGANPYGGTNRSPGCIHEACGQIFRITPEGTFTPIYNFCSQAGCADGGRAYGPLVSAADGNLYGITSLGGANGLGTIFRLTLSGDLTTLHSFNSTDGNCFNEPCAPLIQANSGSLYGTTSLGGTNLRPHTVFGAGTFFKITAGGNFQTLYNFCAETNCADGSGPQSIVEGTDGNFYGATPATLFRFTPEGKLTILHNFETPEGSDSAGVIQATDGAFYGLAAEGGPSSDGVLFRLSVGLGPFVETLPSYGEAGARIKIMGNDLTGTTSVSFDGTAATFNIVSATEVDAVVPDGATSGRIQVVAPTGMRVSNTRFSIQP